MTQIVTVNFNFNYVQKDTGEEKFFTRQNSQDVLDFVSPKDLESLKERGLISIVDQPDTPAYHSEL